MNTLSLSLIPLGCLLKESKFRKTTNSLSTSWMHIYSQAPIVATRVQHYTLNKHLRIKIGYQKIGHQFTPIMAGYITAMFTMN